MNTNLKRKRKSNRLTLGIITALGGLSLLAVGFSTWTFAIKQESDGFTISMQINEAFNGTIINRTNVNLEHITIGYVDDEKSENTGSVAGDSSDTDGKLSTNMNISTNVIVSPDIVSEINGIEVSMGFYESNDTTQENDDTTQKSDKNKVTVTTATTDAFGRTSGDYEYLKLPYSGVTIEPQYAEGSQTEVTGYTATAGDSSYTVNCELKDYTGASGYKEATFTLVNFDISYSNYFGNQAPEVFYSDAIDAKKEEVLANRNNTNTLNAYLNLISAAKAELDTMKEVLENTTLHVNINVTTKSGNTN